LSRAAGADGIEEGSQGNLIRVVLAQGNRVEEGSRGQRRREAEPSQAAAGGGEPRESEAGSADDRWRPSGASKVATRGGRWRRQCRERWWQRGELIRKFLDFF
jgi:hypothetical protein